MVYNKWYQSVACESQARKILFISMWNYALLTIWKMHFFGKLNKDPQRAFPISFFYWCWPHDGRPMTQWFPRFDIIVWVCEWDDWMILFTTQGHTRIKNFEFPLCEICIFKALLNDKNKKNSFSIITWQLPHDGKCMVVWLPSNAITEWWCESEACMVYLPLGQHIWWI